LIINTLLSAALPMQAALPSIDVRLPGAYEHKIPAAIKTKHDAIRPGLSLKKME